MYVPYNNAMKNKEDEIKPAKMPYLDIVISSNTNAGELKKKYADRLNVKPEDLFVITKGNDEIRDHLDNNSKLADIDCQKLYTKVYEVPAPQPVENIVEPMIKDGKALTNDQLVEFNMYIDTKYGSLKKLAAEGSSKANVPRLMRFNPAITILGMKK